MLVTQMTEQGMLVRRQDSADKRIAHLHLTPVARLRALTDGELDALGSALGALLMPNTLGMLRAARERFDIGGTRRTPRCGLRSSRSAWASAW